jgi:chromosome segregation ATPase
VKQATTKAIVSEKKGIKVYKSKIKEAKARITSMERNLTMLNLVDREL